MNDNLVLFLIFVAGVLFPFAVAGICCTVSGLWQYKKVKNAKASTDENK